MNKFSTWLYTLLHGKFVGKDEFGNKYYQSQSSTREFGRKHRWVYYRGLPEPSKVPPQWFNWMHYQSDELPTSNSKKHFWEKAPKPNLTGTASAYYPQGHVLAGGKRDKAIGDYESWNPNK